MIPLRWGSHGSNPVGFPSTSTVEKICTSCYNEARRMRTNRTPEGLGKLLCRRVETLQ
jgi:hypothetical protein